MPAQLCHIFGAYPNRHLLINCEKSISVARHSLKAGIYVLCEYIYNNCLCIFMSPSCPAAQTVQSPDAQTIRNYFLLLTMFSCMRLLFLWCFALIGIFSISSSQISCMYICWQRQWLDQPPICKIDMGFRFGESYLLRSNILRNSFNN